MMRIPKIEPKPADYNERRAEQMMRPTQWALGTLAAVGLATALTAGAAWGYGKLAEPISDAFTRAGSSVNSYLERSVEQGYAPDIEQVHAETVGYRNVAVRSGDTLITLVRESWDIDDEEELGALLRVVQNMNGLEDSRIRDGGTLRIPVDYAHAETYGFR